MKQDIHPPYGPMAFRDRSTGWVTITRSTLVRREHEQVVERFQRRYGSTT